MTNKLNFTKRTIDGLPLPEGNKRAYYNDEQVKGLQLAVTSKGAKSFVLYRRLEGKPTKTTAMMILRASRRRTSIVRGG